MSAFKKVDSKSRRLKNWRNRALAAEADIERMHDDWLDAEGDLRERIRELNARLMPPPTGDRVAGVPPWQAGRLLAQACRDAVARP